MRLIKFDKRVSEQASNDLDVKVAMHDEFIRWQHTDDADYFRRQLFDFTSQTIDERQRTDDHASTN